MMQCRAAWEEMNLVTQSLLLGLLGPEPNRVVTRVCIAWPLSFAHSRRSRMGCGSPYCACSHGAEKGHVDMPSVIAYAHLQRMTA